jgi:hypothetical protein
MALRDRAAARLRRASRGGPGALETAGLVLLYPAAAVVATLSALGSFGSHFVVADAPSGEGEVAAGDHLQTVYRFWLVGHQLTRLDAPWKDPYSFQPLVEEQTSLLGWPFGLPYWPAEAAFGPVVAWNLLLLATIVSAGLLTFAWLRTLALPWAPAALGGLVFAIAPYRLEQSGGHLLGWISLLLPLSLLAIERSRTAESRRKAHAWGAVAAASLVSLPLSGQVHLALGAVPLVLAYAAVRYRPVPAAWCAGGALAALVAGLLIRYTLISDSAESGGRSLAEVGEFSAEWTDFLSRRALGGSEEYVFLGWLTPVLAVVGLVFLWRRARALALLFGVVAIVPAVLALGTNTPLYSPLWHALPPLQFPRVPERLLTLTDLALAALVAFAAAGLATRARGNAAAITAALLVLVTVDLAVQPFEAAAADPGNPAYQTLADAPPGRVLELPMIEPGVHNGSVYDYYAPQAPRERLSGYSTLAPERAVNFYFSMNRLSCGVWLPGDREQLAALGVRHVVFHKGLYRQAQLPGAWFGWRGLQAQGFRPSGGAETVTYFGEGGEIAAPPAPEPRRNRPVLCEGWRGSTMVEREASMWINGGGELELHVSAAGATRARVWVDGRPMPPVDVSGTRTFSVPLGVARWHSIAFEVERLFRTKPPRGLRLERLVVKPG